MDVERVVVGRGAGAMQAAARQESTGTRERDPARGGVENGRASGTATATATDSDGDGVEGGLSQRQNPNPGAERKKVASCCTSGGCLAGRGMAGGGWWWSWSC